MNKDKLYGLSILRIVSMFGIVGLHILNIGGAFPRENLLSVNELPASLFYVFCAASVNTFAMLTGYLYADKLTVKHKNILKLIFTVLVYSTIITMFFMAFKRDVFDSLLDIIKSLIPPLANRFWYITCYVLLFVLIPFINKMINSLTANHFKALVILLIIFTSLIPTFLLRDFFSLKKGYSTAWLIVCYLIGAYIKRNKPKVTIPTLSLVYLLCLSAIMVFAIIGKCIFNSFLVYNILVEYTSPFILIISINSILLFSKIQINNVILTNIIDSFSNSAFDVYIIHSHILIYDFLIQENFIFVRNLHPVLIIPTILGSIIGIYIICWLASQLKLLFFKIIGADALFDKVGQKIDDLF